MLPYLRKFLIGIALLIIQVILLSSCHVHHHDEPPRCIRGSGYYTEEVRYTPAFSSVSVTGPFRVHLYHAPHHEVHLSGEPEILPAIGSSVAGGQLSLFVNATCIEPQAPINIYVYAPYFEAAYAQDIASVSLNGIEAAQLYLSASGNAAIDGYAYTDHLIIQANDAANLNLSGEAGLTEVTAQNSASVFMPELWSTTTRLETWSNRDQTVNAINILDVSIWNSGNVFYTGYPRNIFLERNGPGNLYPY